MDNQSFTFQINASKPVGLTNLKLGMQWGSDEESGLVYSPSGSDSSSAQYSEWSSFNNGTYRQERYLRGLVIKDQDCFIINWKPVKNQLIIEQERNGRLNFSFVLMPVLVDGNNDIHFFAKENVKSELL